MNRIDKKFKELRQKDKKAFIAFITAGYPSLDITKKLVLELDRAGADIIELGVPFSDPMADGPIIQESSGFALNRNKVNILDIISLVKDVRKKTDIPICIMTYYNPIFCLGEEAFVKKSSAAGVDGVIVPDLPPEEAADLIKLTRKYGLDLIQFLSPTSSAQRIKYISSKAKGFIYYVSLTGTTGIRKDLSRDLITNIKAIKKITHKPVCVGFGISRPRHLQAVYKYADGAIVGSAIIDRIKQNLGKRNLVNKVGNFVRSLIHV